MPDEPPSAFYDELAPHYDALFDDWWTAAQEHARIIGRVLHDHGVDPPAEVLDCACGIGTQLLGLAQAGYVMTGTDISSAAVARAAREAEQRGISVAVATSDMRDVDGAASGPHAAVICCDNSIPHLLDDRDLDLALRAIHRVLEPGGLFVATTRDYDALRVEQPTGVPSVLRTRDGGREIVGQAWEWDNDGERVRIHLFVAREVGGVWTTRVHTTWYRALTRTDFTAALERTGYDDVHWLMQGETGYYQPVVTARAAR